MTRPATQAPHPRRQSSWSAGIALGTIAIGTVLTVPWTLRNVHGAEDLRVYRWAIQRVIAGESPYLPLRIGTLAYHPASLTLMWPLAWLSLGGSWAVWTALSMAAWAWTLWVVLRLLRLVDARSTWWVKLAALAATIGPALETLYSGQVNLFVLAGVVSSVWFAERDRPALAGLAYAFASVMKPSPMVFLAYFLAVRQYRVVLWGLVAFGAFTTLTGAHIGWRYVVEYFTMVTQMAGTIRANHFNLSVMSSAFTAARRIGLGDQAAVLLRGTSLLTLGLIAAMLVRTWPRSCDERERLRLAAAFMIVFTVCSPLVWYHHVVLLTLPLAVMSLSIPSWLCLTLAVLVSTERAFEWWVWRWPLPLLAVQSVMLLWAVAVVFRRAKTDGRQPGLVAVDAGWRVGPLDPNHDGETDRLVLGGGHSGKLPARLPAGWPHLPHRWTHDLAPARTVMTP
jgi:alpha-1,2-mannosyltransferase